MKQHPKWTLEQKKQALHKYIVKNFGINIPTQAICHDHVAPFEFICAAFFDLYDLIVALANRSGGKTMDFAILAILDALANDNCECANFGAIQAQALRCYGYMKKFMEANPKFMEMVRGEITMKKTQMQNQSHMEVLTATMSGVNSPHPQKTKADEVELIPWNIMQEALSMTQSRGDVKGVTILGSTRKFAHGPMQRLIDDNQAKVFAWCVWEVMEPWPTHDPVLQERIRQTFIDKFGDTELLPKDLTKFSGYYRWTDLLTKIRALDKETFLTQWMCKKPDSSGLVYPHFDEILNDDPNFVLDTSGEYKQIQIWEDFGYAKPDHPDAIGFVQVDIEHMTFTIFDELWLFEMTTQDIIIEVIQKLQKHGLVDANLLDVSREQLLTWRPDGSPQINYSEFFTRAKLWIPDYHGLTEIADRRKYGCPIPLVPKATRETTGIDDIAKMYEKVNGIPYVRNFIDERRGKFVMSNTPNIRNDFLSYSKKRLMNGQWSDEAEKRYDHGPDLVHYGSLFNWPQLVYQSFAPDTTDSIQIPTKTLGGEDAIMTDSFTGDIMNRRF